MISQSSSILSVYSRRVQMDIKILGWSYENIRRFKKLDIDLSQETLSLPHVSLVMMRNGTGKTTTIHLIRAILSGTAKNWSSEQVREFRPKGKDVDYGKFVLRIKFNQDVYFYTLLLDYENGKASYQTSRVSNTSGGLEDGRILPTALNGVFDVEEFVNRFIFDGEQARKTLNSSSEEAENAIKYLYRVDKLDQLVLRIKDLVSKKQSAEARGASQQSVKNNRTRMDNKERKLKELQQELKEVTSKLEEYYKNRTALNTNREELLRSNSRISDQVDGFKRRKAKLSSDLVGYFAIIKDKMREPYRVHPVFDEMLHSLANNMQTLKLPKTTAREFFRELSEKSHCICGRPIGKTEKDTILLNAEEYLGEEDLVAINAIKDRIRNYQKSDELKETVSNMLKAKDGLDEINGALQRLALQLDGAAQQKVKQIDAEIQYLNLIISETEQRKKLLTAPSGTPRITDQNNIHLAKKAYDEAFVNYHTALGTYEFTKKAERLIQYVNTTRLNALSKLKQTIVKKTNEKIEKIVTDEHIVVEKIDGNLVLQGRSGASEGQTLAIAYAYICSLFEHSMYDFPFVVDSPAASMDLDVRREVAAVIPKLFKQLIIFVTSGEVAGFAEKMYALDDVVYLTIEGEHNGQPAKCTCGKDYFSTYQSEEGEE